MKKILFLFIFISFTLSSVINSHPYEWRFVFTNGSGSWRARNVILYKYYTSSKTLSEWRNGSTKSSSQCDCNGGCDINSDPNGEELCPDSKIWDLLSISSDVKVLVVVEEEGDDYYCKLEIPANVGSGLGYDFILEYDTSTKEFDVPEASNQRGVDLLEQGKYIYYDYTIRNDFGGGLDEGVVKLGSVNNLPSPQYPSYGAWTWPRTATAYNYPTIQGYKREFTEWQKGLINKSYNLTFTLDKEDDIIYTAKFVQLYSLIIQNDLPGYGYTGSITVNGDSRTSPYSLDVEINESFSASGITQTINNVQFTFDEWYKNGSPTQETSPFTPSGNDTYTAKYNAKPLSWYRQLTCPSGIGEYIELNWNEHPCSAVTYKIYRKVGSSGTPVFLANVAHGVEEWTESDYVRTGSTSDPLLQYDVRPYYPPTSTSGDAYFQNIAYGAVEASMESGNNYQTKAYVEREVHDNLEISSYPNPFNPYTTIKYSIPAGGNVVLKVFNSIGKEIVRLVNSNQEAGSYSVIFDGTNLASGIYIYSIQVDDLFKSGKMLLMK